MRWSVSDIPRFDAPIRNTSGNAKLAVGNINMKFRDEVWDEMYGSCQSINYTKAMKLHGNECR